MTELPSGRTILFQVTFKLSKWGLILPQAPQWEDLSTFMPSSSPVGGLD